MINNKLVDSIQRCNVLVEKIRNDCTVPIDKFYGDTAEVLIRIRKYELDRILKNEERIKTILQED